MADFENIKSQREIIRKKIEELEGNLAILNSLEDSDAVPEFLEDAIPEYSEENNLEYSQMVEDGEITDESGDDGRSELHNEIENSKLNQNCKNIYFLSQRH